MSNQARLAMDLPKLCYFCGEEIVKRGRESDSLCVHSLDGNHDNWDPDNKVPTHKKCHTEYHAKNPLLGAEYRTGTHIFVTMPVWRGLMKRRQNPQDSFDKVLRRVLKIDESSDPTPEDEVESGGRRKGK